MKASIIALLLLLASPAMAYNLDTIASDSCHEKLTVQAIVTVLEIFEAQPILVPNDDVLKRLLNSFILPNTGDLSDEEKFVVLSMVVGVRSPDTDGHSTLNLAALRRLHADPQARGQYAHGLRGPDDDYLVGDVATVDGTLGVIREELDEVFAVMDARSAAATGKRAFFIDHYGRVDVTVFLPAYHLGRALHALQDAHAHMLWNDNVSHVVHTLNYVDAVNNVRKTERDGMAHSGALDDCDRNETQPMVERATQRSTSMAAAVLAVARTGRRDLLEAGLTPCPDDLSTLPPLPMNAPANVSRELTCGWLVYNPACRAAVDAGDQSVIDQVCCTAANDYCGSKFAELAMEEPAGPYLGCEAAPGATGSTSPALWMLAGFLLIGLRRRAAMLATSALVLPVLVLVCAAPARAIAAPTIAAPTIAEPTIAAPTIAAPTIAEPTIAAPTIAAPTRAFASVEGHGSFLNDSPNASLLDVTFGYSVRGGYRWGRWRAVLHVEHNAWLVTEYGADVNAGALNFGVGGEVLLFDDLIRIGLVIGPSILLFDTPLDNSGSTGIFSEMRPLGFRYEVADGFIVTFDPLTMSVVAPVLGDPPLRKIERRTYAGMEMGFF